MQNHENIDKIKKFRRELRDELEQIKKQQRVILEQFCIDNGGHYLYESEKWDDDFKTKYKYCPYCGYEEDI